MPMNRHSDDSPDAAAGHCIVDMNVVESIPLSIQNDSVVESQSADEIPDEPTADTDNDIDRGLYPFYSYKDYSKDPDSDPFAPITPPGRVPNFPAKMHAILSRADFSDIVCWMPHGRAWKILKPREFEVRIIPLYFEHVKLSSFIRQANGWDFRRLTKGPDRNCYYCPLFLRGLPHLCKKLKRPGVSKKISLDPEYEPDLYKISELFPVPDTYTDDSVLLHCILEGGPKARMPIYTGFSNPLAAKLNDFKHPTEKRSDTVAKRPAEPDPRDSELLRSFEESLNAAQHPTSSQQNDLSNTLNLSSIPSLIPSSLLPQTSLPSLQLPHASYTREQSTIATLAAANQLAFSTFVAGMLQSSASSHFAAGFAAASAMSDPTFGNILASLPPNNNGGLQAGLSNSGSGMSGHSFSFQTNPNTSVLW